MFHCSICGRFLKDVVGWWNGLGYFVRAEGQCKKHGKVDLSDSDEIWADDFEE